MSEPSKSSSRSFGTLVLVQFLGVCNDNLLKGILTFLVVDGLWSSSLGSGGQAIVFLTFTIPFLLFSGIGGPLADRRSKTWMVKFLKTIEIPIACLSALAFYWQNLWLGLFGMFLLTTQSAFLGPVKYGMLPELMSKGKLTRANGFINMTTNIGAILATKLGGEISDLYDPTTAGQAPDLWLPGIWLVGLALIGWLASFFFSPLPAVAPDSKEKLRFFSVYRDIAKRMRRGPMGKVVLLWVFFYVVATLSLLIIPEYAVVLNISRGHAADLLTIISVAIGLGSLGVGLLAKNRIGMGLVPYAALGMVLCFIALALMPATFMNVAIGLGIAGVFAGAYIVPLQAKIQVLAPEGDRGRFLGTANAFSFAMMAVSAIAYKLLRPLAGDAPYQLFGLCAVLMLGTAVWMRTRPELLDDVTEIQS